MDKITREEEIKVLGSLLYGTLFTGDVNNLFEELHRGSTPQNRLRLELSFQSNAFDMAGFPWEFLYQPSRKHAAGLTLARIPAWCSRAICRSTPNGKPG